MNNFDPFNVRRKHHSIFSAPKPLATSQHRVETSFHELDDISEPLSAPRLSVEAKPTSAAGGMSSYAIPRGATPLNSAQQPERQQRHAHKSTATEKINGMFAAKGELPMYKDKPYNYSGSRKLPFYRKRRTLLAIPAVIALLLLYIAGYTPGSPTTRTSWRSGPKTPLINWNERQDEVKEAFKLSWGAYEKHAWGTPLSTTNIAVVY